MPIRDWLAAAILSAAFLTLSAQADNIKIGLINSDGSRVPLSSASYRNGAELAVTEINASGGVLGRKVALVARNDDGSMAQAAKHAQRLLKTDQVDVLTGSMLSNVALAVARLAATEKKLFVVGGDAMSDAITLDKGNRYTFRLRPSTYQQAAMLAEAAAQFPGRRWAIIAPNYEYGQSAVANFKLLLKAQRPDVEFVAEQWPALGKVRAADAVQILRQSRPDAIFNALFGPDQQQFFAEGARQGLFVASAVYAMAPIDAPDAMWAQQAPMKPWVMLGYPVGQSVAPEHERFREAYAQRFHAPPQLSAIFGYSTIMAVAAGIRKAGSTDTEKLIAAMRGMDLDTPLGPIVFRAQDQQSSMGVYMGALVHRDGRIEARDWRYLDGLNYLPDAAYVKGRRPAAAMK